ncbi:MAG: hypothetical protein GY835_09045, partial [bacterium]|nr:hypothetical protein [bacterium]
YIFRDSNDQLITSREKLSGHEVIPEFATNQEKGLISYHMLIRGGLSLYGELQWRPKWNFKEFQNATKVNEELLGVKADHLRIGEKVKVIIINRATGYMGSGKGVVGFMQMNLGEAEKEVRNDQISVLIPPIQLRPPNLKIKTERKWKVEKGLTAGESRENIIGYEGAGLTSDYFIQVTTEWFDHDGSPLPEKLPGYTGRLARVAGLNRLAAVSSNVENFEIKPGVHIEVVNIPG